MYFSACGTGSGILCYIYLRAERALVFCVVVSSLALWYFLLYFSACGTRPCFSLLFSFSFVWNYLLYIQTYKRKKIQFSGFIIPVVSYFVAFFCVVTFVLYFLWCNFCVIYFPYFILFVVFFALYFSCSFFHVVLKSFNTICNRSFWYMFVRFLPRLQGTKFHLELVN